MAGLLIKSLMFCFVAIIAHAQDTSPSPLHKARIAFQQGKCKQVVALIAKDEFIVGLENESLMVESYKMLGICYYQVGNLQKAEEELQRLFALKPTFIPDPFETPPPVIELCQTIKAKMQRKIRELEDARDNLLKAEVVRKVSNGEIQIVQREIVKKKMSVLAPYIPFGVGQFENGHYLKGSLLASFEILLIGANAGSYWYKQSLLVPGGFSVVPDNDSLHKYNIAMTTQWVALGVFAALHIYGIIDALIYRKSQTIEQITIRTPDEVAKEYAAQTKQGATHGSS
jgi:tetratricopeptide (TPR) repeat protein